MQRRQQRIGLTIAGMALIIASCGGGGDADQPSSDAGTPAATSSEGAAESGGTFTSAFTADDPVVTRASELAVLLVDQLGDDDTAVAAILRAGDAGYDALQIEAAIPAANLAADGTIAGDDPRLAAYGKISGIRATVQDEKPLPIEELRREAAETAGQQDYWPSGAQGTALILSLHLQGYSQDQIVDILILGASTLDGDYDGPIADGEAECGGFVIGGVHEIPQFCDPESGELYPDVVEAATEPSGQEDGAEDRAAGLCNGNFTPPYNGLAIDPVGVMVETVILGPLDTPYYYPEVTGFLDIAADGSFTLAARTVRYADITIRGAPDNQIYNRDFTLTGSFDPETGDSIVTGTITGTDQLWSGDSLRPIEAEAEGEVAVICDDGDGSGFFIAGVATGQGILEFEARP